MTTATVLLVEDNPITRKLVRFTLENNKIAVVEAVDGASAVSAFREHTISLALIDLLLPDMDGFMVLERLRALPSGTEVPMIAFSGLVTATEEARISSVGFDDVITKPVEPSRLVQAVRAHLPPATARPLTTGVRRRLLIADDDAVQRKLVGLRLQRAGYEVTAVADGQEALEAARRDKPDAIVSDVLMPRVDGFGLCVAVRNDPRLADLPVLLVTNSYLEGADRELAHRAGASDLVIRTPELREVIQAIETALVVRPLQAAPSGPEVERERVQRMMKQLERQVAIGARASQRTAQLSAEVSVLSAISEAVATRDDIETALRQVLASCFDAGGVSNGALYLAEPDGTLRAVTFGAFQGWTQQAVADFFGHADLVTDVIREQRVLSIPSPSIPEARSAELLARANVRAALLVPLGHRATALGALLMVSQRVDFEGEDRIAFAQAVAAQISVALTLARAFAEKDASERAAVANETVLRSVLESMRDGVLVSDVGGEVTLWNRAAANVLRASDARSITERLRELSRETPMMRALHGETVDAGEMLVRFGGGEGTWLSVNGRPVIASGGATHGGLAVFRDVTHEKAASAQLLVSDRMASLGTLAAGVAHEINNPLMAVLGNLEMAVQDLEALATRLGPSVDLGELPEELDDARAAADRVRTIVRDLKLFSRSDQAEVRDKVDLERVLESSIRMVWNEIRHRAQLVRDFTPIAPVFANEARLGQVFLNLVVNAAQAIPEGRANRNMIRVSTRMGPDGRVIVEVTDTGQGMPPEVLSKLFTPFFTTKPVGVGTGLGLAICHQLVRAAGGEIQVESTVGKGTTFRVSLPAYAGEAPAPLERRPEVSRTMRRGRILVIDDETIVTTTIRRALADHEVHGLSDAREALGRIESGERFDLILCDLMMPVTTGMEFYEQVLRIAPELARSIVFVTGGAFTAQARAFLDEVPNDRLEKPFDLRTLRALIHERLPAS